MKSSFYLAAALTLPVMIASCAPLPPFDDIGAGRYADDKKTVSPNDVIDHVKCELFGATHSVDKNGQDLSKLPDILASIDPHDLQYFTVGVLMNLKVDDNSGTVPSLAFIDPGSAMQSFTFGLGGTLSETHERTYSEAFLVRMTDLNDPRVTCYPSDAQRTARQGIHLNGINLLGKLGIQEVGKLGLESISDQNKDIVRPAPLGSANGFVGLPTPVAPSPTSPATPTSPAPDTPASKPIALTPEQSAKLAQLPSFGTSLQFVLTKSVGLGPTWTLTDFKGPNSTGGVANSLLNFGRMDTHQIWISFIPDPASFDVVQKQDAVAQDHKELQDLETRAQTGTLSILDDVFRTDTLKKLNTDQAALAKAKSTYAKAPVANPFAGINSMILQNLNAIGPVP